MRIRGRYWVDRMAAVKERLRQPLWWYPFPVILSFGLALVLMAHVMVGANPRAGNPADIIAFPAEPQKDGPLWLSVTPIGEDIVVTTGDRKVFRWRQDVRNLAPLAEFTAYLKERAARAVSAAVLAQEVRIDQTRFVIAADQRLKFLHVRPILYAFAAAGISQYAFETQNPVVAEAEGHGEGHGGGHHGG